MRELKRAMLRCSRPVTWSPQILCVWTEQKKSLVQVIIIITSNWIQVTVTSLYKQTREGLETKQHLHQTVGLWCKWSQIFAKSANHNV